MTELITQQIIGSIIDNINYGLIIGLIFSFVVIAYKGRKHK